jgi:hypothetical protein
MFKFNKTKLQINNKKLAFNNRWKLHLYKPLVKFKGIMVLKRINEMVKVINMSILNNKYNYYIDALKAQDNSNQKNMNTFELKQNFLIENNYLNIIEDKNKIMKLYTNKSNKKNKQYKIIKYMGKNIIDESFNDLESRKLSTKLLKPHYFFTMRYNENSMPSQIRSWNNSVYNFLKFEKSGIKYLDIYSDKLIKLFFNLKYVQRKKIWDTMLLSGLKIKPNLSIIKNLNTMIKYTSTRSSWLFKNVSNYPSIILTFTWVLDQIKFSSSIRKMILSRKEGIISGYKIKKKNYIRKLDKVFISKPLFKHTSFNLIIDLFVYNNKTNKFQKFENILSRRIIYKYMYSMYVNYSEKIKKSLNRPRFFYLNLIEPKIFNNYSNIIKLYENILKLSYKESFLYLCMLLLKWNNICKNKIQILKKRYLFFQYNEFKIKNIINNKSKDLLLNRNIFYNNISIKDEKKNIFTKNYIKDIKLTNINKTHNIVFKNWFFYKNLSDNNNNNNNNILDVKYLNLIKKYVINKDKYNINKEIYMYEREESNRKDYNINKKSNKERKSKFLKYKKYFKELEWKSNTPVNLNNLTLWSRKGLIKEDTNSIYEYRKQDKYFRHNKYSLDQFKRKIYYAKGKRKRKVSPRIWKQKLMSFFLFSRAQKKDTNSNKKFFNVNNKFINTESNSSIFNKKKTLISNIIKNDNKFITNNKYFNEFNSQINKEKGIVKSFNTNKKDHMKVIPLKNSFSLKKNESNDLFFKDSLKNKDILINNINDSNYENNNLLNGLFSKFFLLNFRKDTYINIVNDKKFILSKLNEIRIPKKYKFNLFISKKKNINKNNLNILYFKNINKNTLNSKTIWDNLDNSIFDILKNNYFLSDNNNNNLNIKSFSYKILFNKIKNIISNNNIWYIHLIKKEFYSVNRDVILSKLIDVLPDNNKNILLSNDEYHYNSYNSKYLKYNSNTFILNINVWINNKRNKSSNNLRNKLSYNEEIFKPYYRYMIPLFIYESYKSFILHLGYKNSLINIKTSLYTKFNWLVISNLTILNFILVKTLLDLMHYNYKSLIRVKPKYYYLNKLRYYSIKLKKLNFNTWIASVKYIKRLRKTPRHFWFRYHKLASFYYNRIIKNAELDTKRKVLLPFVFYFEDLLFNIYGKWVIVRLWPIKRYYLNSFILAERIMSVILLKESSTSSILEYRHNARNLINILRWSQVNRAYNFYNENNSRWPDNLINIMKGNNSSHYLNYNTLEFFNSKLEKNYILNTYPLNKAKLNNYLPSVKFHYVNAFKNNFKTIKNWSIKNKLIYKKGKINSIRYVYYWLRPLNSYLMYLKNHLDITGIKFKLTGRPGVIKSNVRSFSKTYFYGNLLGPRHFNSKILKTTSLMNPMLRGTIKSNIDYSYYTSKSNNGSITLKIWMSSLFSSDIHELILYILRIKNLYSELVNRYYLVYSKFANLNSYYLFNKVNKIIKLKKNIKRRKISKRFINKIRRKNHLSFINEYKIKRKIK